jgi:hypothetical protein
MTQDAVETTYTKEGFINVEDMMEIANTYLVSFLSDSSAYASSFSIFPNFFFILSVSSTSLLS